MYISYFKQYVYSNIYQSVVGLGYKNLSSILTKNNVGYQLSGLVSKKKRHSTVYHIVNVMPTAIQQSALLQQT